MGSNYQATEANSFYPTAPYMPLGDSQHPVQQNVLPSYPVLQPPRILNMPPLQERVEVPENQTLDKKEIKNQLKSSKLSLIRIMKAMRFMLKIKIVGLFLAAICILSAPSGPFGILAILAMIISMILYGFNLKVGRRMVKKMDLKLINDKLKYVRVIYYIELIYNFIYVLKYV